jgi:hypothetical protein
MSRELPELPERRALPVIGSGIAGHALGYTADQMRAYAEQAVRLEREACAKVCESTYPELVEGQLLTLPCFDTPDDCAAAIRARSTP